ncbi:MAG: ubiquinol-cytochrome C chaperone [Alphaproteobacteria bacterium]|nr:ubiquinol-cytochrome C chaperone [Alphaproteobacteria bacterium]MDX5414839.1 ubiquinol-cytochrome C chaperone [Alphaproteobacteria bacterium]MDX5492025.1 ubiquinol-cytochrome C chaperone [Alphaproteobacteria bacterium]
MIWKRIFGRPARNDVPMALYAAAVRQARSPAFYLEGGVPDTVEGRFEMVSLHACLVLRRLRDGGPEGKETGQKVFDILFDDMDQTLREMGVGDLSVGKKIKALASSFYGRLQAYDEGFKDSEGDTLAAAILRNVFAGDENSARHAAALASYMRRVDEALRAQDIANVLAGRIEFGAPFEATETSETR